MRLLTICDNCCIKLDWNSRRDQDRILSIRSINKISASLVLRLLYKEVKTVASSKGIIKEVAINTIKIVSINSK